MLLELERQGLIGEADLPGVTRMIFRSSTKGKKMVDALVVFPALGKGRRQKGLVGARLGQNNPPFLAVSG